MAKILVIGNGVVGSATGEAFKKMNHEVSYYDIDMDKSDLPDLRSCNDYDFTFISVPTSTYTDEGSNTYKQNKVPLITALEALNHFDYKGIIVIKSTVLPGTCDDMVDLFPTLRIIHSPEFLTAANAYEDTINATHIVLSGQDDDIKETIKLYEPFPKMEGFHMTNSYKETETVKYFKNYFLAMKVALSNEIYELCLKHGINYEFMRMVMFSDDRIGKSHMSIDHKHRGYGGMCFPKDTKALLGQNPEMELLRAMDYYNMRIRRDDDDAQ